LILVCSFVFGKQIELSSHALVHLACFFLSLFIVWKLSTVNSFHSSSVHLFTFYLETLLCLLMLTISIHLFLSDLHLSLFEFLVALPLTAGVITWLVHKVRDGYLEVRMLTRDMNHVHQSNLDDLVL
jgi:hypothetical protein